MSDEDGNDDAERTHIRSELAAMSFEELQKLKEKLGAKDYNEAVFGENSKKKSRSDKTVFKRENKNRPREMSSKKPVPFISEMAPPKESTLRDPRFDSLCGTFNPTAFKRSYSFVKDVRDDDLKMLKRELKNTTDPEREGQIKYLIQRMENQNREESRRKEKAEKFRVEREEREQMIKEGKTPAYVKKSDKKMIDLVEQYEDLKKSGKLEKHITKYRKKNAQKARKKMNVM